MSFGITKRFTQSTFVYHTFHYSAYSSPAPQSLLSSSLQDLHAVLDVYGSFILSDCALARHSYCRHGVWHCSYDEFNRLRVCGLRVIACIIVPDA